MSGDILSCHYLGFATGIWWLETRDAARRADTLTRLAQTLQQRVTRLGVQMVPPRRNRTPPFGRALLSQCGVEN